MNPGNNFYGSKTSIPGINVNNATPSQLLYQLNLDTGTQTFNGTSGNIGFGLFISAVTGEQTMGMQVQDVNGNVTFEMDGQTWYWFDNVGNIVMEVGYLQLAGIFGWAVSTPGQTLAGVV